jgi:hypothetical protein
MLYNEPEDKLFCPLDAPDENVVDKHHQKFGVGKCE